MGKGNVFFAKLSRGRGRGKWKTFALLIGQGWDTNL
jgi:hypothetical protein